MATGQWKSIMAVYCWQSCLLICRCILCWIHRRQCQYIYLCFQSFWSEGNHCVKGDLCVSRMVPCTFVDIYMYSV